MRVTRIVVGFLLAALLSASLATQALACGGGGGGGGGRLLNGNASVAAPRQDPILKNYISNIAAYAPVQGGGGVGSYRIKFMMNIYTPQAVSKNLQVGVDVNINNGFQGVIPISQLDLHAPDGSIIAYQDGSITVSGNAVTVRFTKPYNCVFPTAIIQGFTVPTMTYGSYNTNGGPQVNY